MRGFLLLSCLFFCSCAHDGSVPSEIYKDVPSEDFLSLKVGFVTGDSVKEIKNSCRKRKEACLKQNSPQKCAENSCWQSELSDFDRTPEALKPFIDKRLVCSQLDSSQANAKPETSFESKLTLRDNFYFGVENGNSFGPAIWLYKVVRRDGGSSYFTDRYKIKILGGMCDSKYVFNLIKEFAVNGDSFQINEYFDCSFLIFFKKSYSTSTKCRVQPK